MALYDSYEKMAAFCVMLFVCCKVVLFTLNCVLWMSFRQISLMSKSQTMPLPGREVIWKVFSVPIMCLYRVRYYLISFELSRQFSWNIKI